MEKGEMKLCGALVYHVFFYNKRKKLQAKFPHIIYVQSFLFSNLDQSLFRGTCPCFLGK